MISILWESCTVVLVSTLPMLPFKTFYCRQINTRPCNLRNSLILTSALFSLVGAEQYGVGMIHTSSLAI